MNEAQQIALAMLRGCPTGATEHALATHGIERATLDALVAAGHAVMSIDKYAHGQRVTRFQFKQ